MRHAIDVAAVNKVHECVLLTDGSLLPITNWFDEDGEDASKWDAVGCVAGAGATWWAIDLRSFAVSDPH